MTVLRSDLGGGRPSRNKAVTAVIARSGNDEPLVLHDTANLDSDGGQWRQVAIRARVRVERRADGWWLVADPDVRVGGVPIVRPLPFGGMATVRGAGVPPLTLMVDPSPRPLWNFWVDSDMGPRFRQEDAVAAGEWFLVAADGVGSRPAGDVASVAAVRAAAAAIVAAGGPRATSALADFVEAAVADLIAGGVGARGMTTTLTIAIGAPAPNGVAVHVLHVGDSALLWYQRAAGTLQMITRPHHLPDQPNKLLRAVTDDAAPVLDPVQFVAQPGDILVACTDGLTGALDHLDLLEVLAAHHSEAPAAIGEELIGAAILAGTGDNVSVAVAVIPDDGEVIRSYRSRVLVLPRPEDEATTLMEE